MGEPIHCLTLVLEESRMSFRVSALVAAAAVLGLGSLSPVFAQPQVPVKPRYTAFQNVFSPYRPLVANPGQGIQGFNQPVGNPNGPQAPGFVLPGQLLPGQLGAGPQQATGPGAVNPALPPTGIPASFNNLGHWYNRSSGFYGAWYLNGLTNGNGALGSTGNSGLGSGPVPRQGGSLMGTALMGAAAVGQLRR
jgi:hypothetical protein